MTNVQALSASPLSYKTIRRLKVIVVHRHGDRSPITSLKDEDYWKRQLIPKTTLEELDAMTKVLTNGEENTHSANGRGPFGKLTLLGLEQMVDLGESLRKDLEGSKSFSLESEPRNRFYPYIWTEDKPLIPSNVRVVSTSFDRTMQSAQGVIKGLFGKSQNHKELDLIAIDTRQTNIFMLPDPQPRQTKEQEALENKLANRQCLHQREMELLPLAIRVTKALQPLLAADAREANFGAKQLKFCHSSDAPIEIEPLAWNQLGEILKCLSCRQILPSGITEADHEMVVQHAAWRWFATFRHPRLAFLGMNTLCKKMVNAFVNHFTEPPMTLYSGHDSTLIGLLCAFKLEQPVAWPEYGSHLMMELLEVEEFHNDSSSKDLFVRFSLNNSVLRTNWEQCPAEMIRLAVLVEHLENEDSVTKHMTGDDAFAF